MPPAIHVMDVIGPLIGGCVFIAIMSVVVEPMRQRLNALLVGGAAAAYISGGGFGAWELIFPLLATPVAYRGLQSYQAIGIAWLMHSAWDAAHHLWGQPIWPFMPTSSFGCLIFDAVIAAWFLMNAPGPMAIRLARDPS